jgi:hypothetical protein
VSIVAEVPTKPKRPDRTSRAFQDSLWAKWPTPAQWPGSLDLYEAAAYKRVAYLTLWRACQKGRDGMARLEHQRLGSIYRVDKAKLDAFGRVKERSAA